MSQGWRFGKAIVPAASGLLPELFYTTGKIEVAARLGTSIAAGQAPARIGWAILGFLVIAITQSVVRDVVVPVLKILGKCWSAKLEARLMPSRQQKENR